ncbi:hypothetical protein ACHAW6_004796, partial [Cyclotella cf. meneghiniana]
MNIWTILGKEFGDYCDWKAMIVWALYGLKSSGAAFRANLAGCLHKIGNRSYPAYPDLPERQYYYDFILCYVDNLVVVHHNPRRIMNKNDSFLPLKPDSVGCPELYLGAKLKKTTFEDGTVAWGRGPL